MKLIFSITSVLLSLLITNYAFAQGLVIKAGHLVLPGQKRVLKNQSIRIEGKTITEIGQHVAMSNADTMVDLSDSWVLPGLIDAHVHITWNEEYRSWKPNSTYITESTALRALRGSYNARLFLQNGFTTIRDVGNDANYATADVIEAIDSGWIEGPTIVYSGKIIAPYAGQSQDVIPDYENFWSIEYMDADNPREIEKAVRKNIYNGATAIKLVAQNQPDSYYYDLEDIKAAVKEANKSGLKVSAHVMGGEAAKNVILGGAASIEHGDYLSNELLELMKDQGTYLVGTNLTFDNWYAYGLDSLTSQTLHNNLLDRLKRADEVGVKMAYGTDIVINLEGKNRVESSLEVLKTWKAADIAPMKVLQTMTVNAADLLGIGNERGSIQKGYYADIVALKKNPLENIQHLRNLHFVMKEGRIIRNE